MRVIKFVKFLSFLLLINNIATEPVTVHVVPHSHDDPGWLWTFDELFYGYNTPNCVKCILDSVLDSLIVNTNRTFCQVEMSFFTKWYKDLDEYKQRQVKELVESERLEFATGGWVMHDEATSYYQHLLDNMRIGLQFIKREFNKTVETGWFIDPFGHSSANVNPF